MVDKTGNFHCFIGGKQSILFRFFQVNRSCFSMGEPLFDQQFNFQTGYFNHPIGKKYNFRCPSGMKTSLCRIFIIYPT
jgi:hypothetical protein